MNDDAPEAPLTLSDTEKLALAGLLRLAIRLDGRFSPEERSTLDAIAEELFAPQSGQHETPKNPYRGALAPADEGAPPDNAAALALGALLDRAAAELPDEESIRAAARMVTRQEAREVLYGAVFSVAASDTISTSEMALLRWLETEWNIPAPSESA